MAYKGRMSKISRGKWAAFKAAACKNWGSTLRLSVLIVISSGCTAGLILMWALTH